MAVRIAEFIWDNGPAAGNTSMSNRPRWSPDRGLRPWSSDPSSVVRMYGRGGAPHKYCAFLSDTMMGGGYAQSPAREFLLRNIYGLPDLGGLPAAVRGSGRRAIDG